MREVDQVALDRFGNGLCLGQDVIVPEPEYAKATLGKEAIALCVVLRARMLAAVDFDDEAAFEADEIEDVAVIGVLPTKLAAVELLSAKHRP